MTPNYTHDIETTPNAVYNTLKIIKENMEITKAEMPDGFWAPRREVVAPAAPVSE